MGDEMPDQHFIKKSESCGTVPPGLAPEKSGCGQWSDAWTETDRKTIIYRMKSH